MNTFIRNTFFLSMVSFLIPFSLKSQESWSLENCIREAQQKSITVQQSRINIENAKISLAQDKMSRYPNLNSGTNLSLSSGRFIDPTTNSFETASSFINSWNINSGVQLYTGGRVKNTIKKDKLDIKAAELNAQQSEQDIALQVAQAYLSVLLSEEQLTSARQRMELSQAQIKQTDKLIKAGLLPKNNRLDLDAQVAREQQTIIAAQNAVDLSLLSLKQIMFMELSKEIIVEKPGQVDVPNVNLDAISIDEMYQTSYNTQPGISAGQYELNSAEMSEKIAASTKMPTISAFGGINTNYSNRSKIFDQQQVVTITELPVTGELNGVPTTGYINTPSVGFEVTEKNYPYFSQIWDNLSQNIGISISYPLWDNRLTKSNIERARLQTESVRMRNEITQQNLRVEIQNALATAKAAQKTYESALSSVTSLKASYENTKKKFDVGTANSFELTTAKNNLALAETEVIRSKYDFLFRLKILDFYQGKAIKL